VSNPFDPAQAEMLATLLQALGSGDPGQVQHTLARQVARAVATQGGQEPNVDPSARMRLEELGQVAALHVSEQTEVAVASDAQGFSLVAVTRGDFADRTLERIEPLMAEIASATADKGLLPGQSGPTSSGGSGGSELPGSSEGAGGTGPFGLPLPDNAAPSPFGGAFLAGGEPEGLPPGLGGLFGPFSSLLGRAAQMFGPTLLALQTGGLVGELAGVAMTGTELLVPGPPSHLATVVAANVASFAEAWGVRSDDAFLWVAISELSRHVLLDRSSVRERLGERLRAHAKSYAETQQDLARRVEELDLGDPSELGRVLSDPSLLFGSEPSPAQRRAAELVRSATAAIDAAASHVAATVGARLLPSWATIAEAGRRQRLDRATALGGLELLLGMDSGPHSVEEGQAFVNGVIERAGEDGLRQLWTHPDGLPTPAELQAPGLWLERLSL